MLILKSITNKVKNCTLTQFLDHLRGDIGDVWSKHKLIILIINKLGLSCSKLRSNLTSLRNKEAYYFCFLEEDLAENYQRIFFWGVLKIMSLSEIIKIYLDYIRS